MAKLLLIDDDRSLTELLAEYLTTQGHVVEISPDGMAGLRAFYSLAPDLVILDVSMPLRDGWATLERIRELSSTPVIMLTARAEESSVLRGFSLGADDYVAKPFSFAQLAARVGRILARARRGADAPDADQLHIGGISVDLQTKRAWRDKELVHLTPTEFRLLVALMEHSGKVLLPEDLIRSVWGEQYLNDVGYVRRYVWHLRQKIEPDPDHPRYIHNERGFGYRFEDMAKPLTGAEAQ